MRNPIEIDYSHSRAIIQEIGESLRTSLKEDRELPAGLRSQIDRLRQLEGQVAAPQPLQRNDQAGLPARSAARHPPRKYLS